MAGEADKGATGATTGRLLLHKGGIANADVFRAGAKIEKDYTGKPWLVRLLYGRQNLAHEFRILKALEPFGIVPGGNTMSSRDMLTQDFVEGPNLRTLIDERRFAREDATVFLARLEEAVRTVHAAGYVHLDLHNARNIMVAPGLRPLLIDWQSGFRVRWLPGFARRFLQRIDLAGVYKQIEICLPGTLTESQAALLGRQRFLRRLWPFNKGQKPGLPANR